MIETRHLILLPTTEQELPELMDIERHPENRPELFVSTLEEHLFHLNSDNFHLFSICEKQGNMVGYAMVQVDDHSKTFLLRRVAITKKNQGYGRSALSALLKWCFEERGYHRFYLDVYPHNRRAIHLYEELGLVWEGTLRENYNLEGVYLDQRLYAMLDREFFMTPLAAKSFEEL